MIHISQVKQKAEFCELVESMSTSSNITQFVVFEAACALLGLYSYSIVKKRKALMSGGVPQAVAGRSARRFHKNSGAVVIDSNTQIDRRKYSRVHQTSPPIMEMEQTTTGANSGATVSP